VRFAVYLDRQTGVVAVEVEIVGASRVLAAEFEAGGFFAKHLPEQDFGKAHRAAKATGATDASGGAFG
jgi:hypothetical protein